VLYIIYTYVFGELCFEWGHDDDGGAKIQIA